MATKKLRKSRGQMIARGPNKWLLRVYLGRDANGKRKYHNQTVEGTTAQARAELTKLVAQADAKQIARPSKQTVDEFMASWFKGNVEVSERTLANYKWVYEKYLRPRLGNVRLDKLNIQQVQLAYSAMQQEGKSPRTVRLTHSVLRQALGHAVEWGLIPKNPTARAKLPRKVHKEYEVYSVNEMTTLLNYSRVHESEMLNALWHVLLLGGLRPQEALALRWADFDGEKIRIQRALTHDKSKRWHEADTKTKGSRRTVHLPAVAVEALNRWRRTQALDLMKTGVRTGLAFHTASGAFLDISNVRRWWKRVGKKAGLKEVRLYDARHTHATSMLALGEHLKVVSERLGHSSVQITGDVYSHVKPTMQRESAKRLNVAVAGGGV